MKYFNYLTTSLVCLLVMVGCSPAGNQSAGNTTPSDMSDALDTTTSASLNTSASATLTIPPDGQQPYSVVHGVGQVYDLPSGMTHDQQNNPTGYRVNISISTDSN